MMLGIPHFWTYPLCFVRFVRQLFAHPMRFLLQELAVSVENRSHFFWLLEMIEIWTRTAKISVGT